ncbi:signal peptidase I [Pseudodesulfovibrio sp.]|uniref:signal peptidase I n=1 Tax=unclassified Pseudodesulfovibrio TaxID=2661612 RepID=UPI003B0029EC
MQSDPAITTLSLASPSLPRRPWVALVLSLIATGAGQVYNGRWQKGLLFLVGEFLLGCVLAVAMGTLTGLVAAGIALLAVNIWAAADAFIDARTLREFTPGPWNRSWVYAVIVVVSLGAGALVRNGLESFFYETYKAPSGSMIPTLQVGDHFMAEVLSADQPVNRGDVIVFLETGSGRNFVKRVVGLPGETVAIAGQRVSINGRPLDESFVFHSMPGTHLPGRDVMRPVRLGSDEYFCMGDNRECSYDSRWLGPIKRSSVRARALYVYFPGPSPSGRWARLGASLR